MTWTTTPPTQPGWYWVTYKEQRKPQLVKLCGSIDALGQDNRYAVDQHGDFRAMGNYTNWYGPLTPPPLPEERHD